MRKGPDAAIRALLFRTLKGEHALKNERQQPDDDKQADQEDNPDRTANELEHECSFPSEAGYPVNVRQRAGFRSPLRG